MQPPNGWLLCVCAQVSARQPKRSCNQEATALEAKRALGLSASTIRCLFCHFFACSISRQKLSQSFAKARRSSGPTNAQQDLLPSSRLAWSPFHCMSWKRKRSAPAASTLVSRVQQVHASREIARSLGACLDCELARDVTKEPFSPQHKKSALSRAVWAENLAPNFCYSDELAQLGSARLNSLQLSSARASSFC